MDGSPDESEAATGTGADRAADGRRGGMFTGPSPEEAIRSERAAHAVRRDPYVAPFGPSPEWWRRPAHERGTRPTRRRGRAEDDTDGPALITGARVSPFDEHRARVRRYFILMSFRFPALFLAAFAQMRWNNLWLTLGIIAGSIPLPWIAVLLANDGPPKDKRDPRRVVGSGPRRTPLAGPPRAAIAAAASHRDGEIIVVDADAGPSPTDHDADEDSPSMR